ncbi:MAG: YidC/Oxa1 family membrane protein insertase [Clostridiales bacterium]|nr:YidC/Oxa1 family membrane protein insertase [Clostridiales bacterium]
MINMAVNPILLASTTGISIFKPLYYLFGYCMEFLMNIFSNEYVPAIIVLTIVTRLILLPFNLHQQKTTAKTARLQPKIQKIQKKYNVQGVSDPKERQRMQQKLNEEMQELYAREGHNPMQMGCGTMIFQMIFLMGIIGIIYYPLSYVLGISAIGDYTDELTSIVKELLGISDSSKTFYLQLKILEGWDQIKDTLMAQFPELFTAEKASAIEAYRSGFYLFGLDLTVTPTWKGGAIVLVPIVSFITSLGSTAVSMLIQKKNNPAAQQGAQMIMMMLMMPLFSLFIAFQVPAAVGFYWIISNLVAILQQLFIAKFFPPRKSQAKLMIENTIERRSREENINKTNKSR